MESFLQETENTVNFGISFETGVKMVTELSIPI